MSSLPSHLIVAAIFFLLHAIISVDAVFVLDTDYIPTTCNATKIPGFCKKSLSSMSTGLFASQRVRSHMLRVSQQLNNTKGTDPKMLSAANSCMHLLENVANQMDVKFIVKSIPTLTEDNFDMTFDDIDMNIFIAGGDLHNCREQWTNITDGPIKADVCNKLNMASKFVVAARDALNQLKAKLRSGSAETPPPAGCKACVCCPDKKLGPGGCCQCCDPSPLPSTKSTADKNAEFFCEANEEECKKWARETA